MKRAKILSIVLVGVIAVSVLARVAQIPVASPKLPAPAWDSGWFQVDQTGEKTLTHNIGGNVDKYVVDMQYKTIGLGDPDGSIHTMWYGGDINDEKERRGAFWSRLNTTSIRVYVNEGTRSMQVRIRIWVHN